MDADDTLELVAWALEQALANRLWDIYHHREEIAIPLRRQGATVPEGSVHKPACRKHPGEEGGARELIRNGLLKELSCR